MAQVLKEETREKIIEAAKEEILHYGYDEANMRRIAQKSNMTVGNLYRYFKNKEDINYQIVSKVLSLLDDLVKNITDNRIAFFNEDFILPDNREVLKSIINELSDKIVDIYVDYRDEFNILMMGSQLSERLIQWFAKLIGNLIGACNKNVDKKQIDLLSNAYAIGVIDGLKELFWTADVNVPEFKRTVRIFLQSFIFMLQTDVGKYIGEENE